MIILIIPFKKATKFFLSIFLLMLFQSVYGYSDTEHAIESMISDEIASMNTLLDNNILSVASYEASRQKLLVLLDHYRQEGGNDYRYIISSEIIINEDYVKNQDSKEKADAFKICLIKYGNLNGLVNVPEFCQKAVFWDGSTPARNIKQIFDGTIILLSAINKLDNNEANSLLEKHYTETDKRKKGLPGSPSQKFKIQQNGDEYINLLIEIDALNLPGRLVINERFIKELTAVAKLDIKENRLSTPINRNALNKYKNILKLDANNSEAKLGLINITNKYLDMADTSAKKGQTSRVKLYLVKASQSSLTPISIEHQKKLLSSSEEIEDSIKEQQANAEAERKRLAEAEAERILQQSLITKKNKQESKRVAGLVEQYSSMIKQRIKRYWNRPSSTTSGLQVTLHVSLLPGGKVKSVSIVNSSGSNTFDQSAESAVYTAAPLPVSFDPKVAVEFQEFQFIFN